MRVKRQRRCRIAAGFVSLAFLPIACGGGGSTQTGTGPPKVTMGELNNSSTAVLPAEVKRENLAKKHNIRLSTDKAASLNPYFADFRSGRTDCMVGSPALFATEAAEGLPVTVAASWAPSYGYLLAPRGSGISDPGDLKGKRLAGNAAGSTYRQIATAAKAWHGTSLKKDVNFVQAQTGGSAIAQMVAGKAAAAIAFETDPSSLFQKESGFHVAYNASKDFRKHTDISTLWHTVVLCRTDAGLSDRAIKNLVSMLAEAGKTLNNNSEHADKLAVEVLNAEPGVYGSAFKSGRLTFDINPINDTVRTDLRTLMEVMMKHGAIDRVDIPGSYFGQSD